MTVRRWLVAGALVSATAAGGVAAVVLPASAATPAPTATAARIVPDVLPRDATTWVTIGSAATPAPLPPAPPSPPAPPPRPAVPATTYRLSLPGEPTPEPAQEARPWVVQRTWPVRTYAAPAGSGPVRLPAAPAGATHLRLVTATVDKDLIVVGDGPDSTVIRSHAPGYGGPWNFSYMWVAATPG